MPRRFLRKWMPSRERIHGSYWLRKLGPVLHSPQLWHLNRSSTARAFAIGLFWAFIPMPMQMLPAALCAIWLRGNAGLSIALVWITNPLTMGPIYYVTYVLGSVLLGMKPAMDEFALSWEWLRANFNSIWMPLYVGALVLGVAFSFLGYWMVQGAWRWHVGHRHHKRQRRRREISASPIR